eukprot:jgi/Chlat1/5853/Chrsp4S06235
MPSLVRRRYVPFPGLADRHVETIAAALFRQGPHIRYRRECLTMPDGGTVALDWPSEEDTFRSIWMDVADTAPLLVLLPGLTGGSHDAYVRHQVAVAQDNGYRAVVFNSRGCADSPVTTAQFYSASFTEDLRGVLRHVRGLFPNAPLIAVGWSLGANILTRYLGQEGERTPLLAAVSLCNPFDLVLADAGFQVGFNKVYDRRLARSLRNIFTQHLDLWQGVTGDFDVQKALTCRSIRDFDDAITRVSFGYSSVAEYYADSSSKHAIPNIRIPLLCLQAENDPIAPIEGTPIEAIEANPNTILGVSPGGGHLGWCAGPDGPFGEPWSDRVVIEFINAVLMAQLQRREVSRELLSHEREAVTSNGAEVTSPA